MEIKIIIILCWVYEIYVNLFISFTYQKRIMVFTYFDNSIFLSIF